MKTHEELVDIYDDAMTKIGVAKKKDVHVSGAWHKSIHCWIFMKDSEDKYVIFQKRSTEKKLMPNYFDVSVAGHYELGELPIDGLREVEEEIGLSIPVDSWKYLGVKFDVNMNKVTVNREFCDVFFAECNTPISHYKMLKEEVDAIVKIPISEGLKLFSGNLNSLKVDGIKWDNERMVPAQFLISPDLFIPRIDSYYLKIFIMADLYFSGYRYFSI